MARYYLHIRESGTLIEDFDGIDLPDLAAARAEALAAAREILAERLLGGDVLNGQTFEIMDDRGTLLASVPFKEALRLPPAGKDRDATS